MTYTEQRNRVLAELAKVAKAIDHLDKRRAELTKEHGDLYFRAALLREAAQLEPHVGGDVTVQLRGRCYHAKLLELRRKRALVEDGNGKRWLFPFRVLHPPGTDIQRNGSFTEIGLSGKRVEHPRLVITPPVVGAG